MAPSKPGESASENVRDLDDEGGYATLELEVTWRGNHPPSADDFIALLMGAQVLAELVSPAGDEPTHLLGVTEIKHPNMSLSFRGLAATVRELANVIRAVPEALIGLILVKRTLETARAKLEAERAKYEAEGAVQAAKESNANVAVIRAQAACASAQVELEADQAFAQAISEMIRDTARITDPGRRLAAMTETMRYKREALGLVTAPMQRAASVRVKAVTASKTGVSKPSVSKRNAAGSGTIDRSGPRAP
jgi:hypothetical protein